nr:hypothetical transcript [Hymenolepis microstoma]
MFPVSKLIKSVCSPPPTIFAMVLYTKGFLRGFLFFQDCGYKPKPRIHFKLYWSLNIFNPGKWQEFFSHDRIEDAFLLPKFSVVSTSHKFHAPVNS